MSDDAWKDPEWLAYAKDAQENLLPMIQDSAVTMLLAPGEDPDAKVAIELGFMLLLDKPLILVVPPGRKVQDHLVRVADAIIEVGSEAEFRSPALGARIQAEAERVLRERGES